MNLNDFFEETSSAYETIEKARVKAVEDYLQHENDTPYEFKGLLSNVRLILKDF